MRCKRVQEMLGELKRADFPQAAREHLEGCAACQSYVRQWSVVAAGMTMLSREPVPEPSLGFSARIVRRLEAAAARFAPPEFLERAGRRVVLATLILVCALLLAMILPSSGPVRHPPNVESYWQQPETMSAAAYPVSFGLPPVPTFIEMKPVSYSGSR
ncbi:MAG: anti-sigma factor family protein [Terriglobia bacterium]